MLASILCLLAGCVNDAPAVILVVGADGTPEYGKLFSQWADRWQQAAEKAGAKTIVVGRRTASSPSDAELLQKALQSQSQEASAELWLVLIGHGTFDGKTAKFNLRGPDFSAAELAGWLAPLKRPVAVINCASSSGPFLNTLAAPNRVVITATKSGHEVNFARFGEYISQAISDPQADLDKDGQTSLLEAYLSASRQVADFYTSEARLATEHALLDDTGDGLGTPADWFRGIRAVRTAKDGAAHDGPRAHQFHLQSGAVDRTLTSMQRARRNELELALQKLRETKTSQPEDEYYRRLESLLIELSTIYEQSESDKSDKDSPDLPPRR